MSNAELFLVIFSIIGLIGSIVVYNIDFTKWDKHSHV